MLAHQVAEVQPSENGRLLDCQLCKNGFGPIDDQKHQIDAHLMCVCCGIQVCSGTCWKTLRGMK